MASNSVRLSRKVRQPVKTLLTFDDNSFPRIGQSNYSDRVGEAQTGNAGERPDRGIAGRNSSRRWARARSSRRVLGLEPGHGREAMSGSGLGFKSPHRIDRFRDASENASDGRRNDDRRGSPA